MNNTPRKKSIIPSLLVLAILVVGAVAIFKIDKVDKKLDTPADQEEQQEKNNEYGESTQDSISVFDLIGTGTYLGNGIATSTTATGVRVPAPEVFQFASSSNDYSTSTWWNTTKTNYPHTYGATPTAAFLIAGAESVTFGGVFTPKLAASTMDLYIYASNDDGCNNPSSTLNLSKWLPVPVTPTTTGGLYQTIGLGPHSTTSVLHIATGVTTERPFSFALPKEYLNFNCLMVEAGNSSTTDASTLWLEVSIVR